MKLGDLVIPGDIPRTYQIDLSDGAPQWHVGVVIGFEHGEPIVYWNSEFNSEIEYRDQLEVIS